MQLTAQLLKFHCRRRAFGLRLCGVTCATRGVSSLFRLGAWLHLIWRGAAGRLDLGGAVEPGPELRDVHLAPAGDLQAQCVRAKGSPVHQNCNPGLDTATLLRAQQGRTAAREACVAVVRYGQALATPAAMELQL